MQQPRQAMLEARRRGDSQIRARELADRSVPLVQRLKAIDLLLGPADSALALAILEELLQLPGDGAVIAQVMRRIPSESADWAPSVRLLLPALAERFSLDDGLCDAILEKLAKWTKGSLTLAVWDEAAAVTQRVFTAFRNHQPRRACDPRLLRAVLWCCELTLMLEAADFGLTHHKTPEERQMLAYMVSNLIRFAERPQVRLLAERLYYAEPRDPIAIDCLARVWDGEKREATEIAGLYDRLDAERNPQLARQSLNWIGQRCYAEGLQELARGFFVRAVSAAGSDPPQVTSWPERILGTTRPGSNSGEPKNLLGLVGLPDRLSLPLVKAVEIAREDQHWDGVRSLEQIAEAFAGITAEVTGISFPADIPLFDWTRASQRLIFIARSYLSPFAHYFDVSPVLLAPKYGRIRVSGLREIHGGLMSVAATLAEMGLNSVLAGMPFHPVGAALRLMEFFVTASVGSHRLLEAVALLERLCAHPGLRAGALHHLETCALHLGDIELASTCLDGIATKSSVFRKIESREDWTRREGMTWSDCLGDPPLKGEFEIVWPDGRLDRHDHVVPANCLRIAAHQSFLLRRGEVIVGLGATILRPQRLHYPLLYPGRTPDVLAQGERAVRFRDLGPPVDAAEPLLVMENFDALHHRNYYHWLILLLPRISYAHDAGLMDGRRLVVPEGLSAWMLDSLKALGIGEERLYVAPPGKSLRLSGALIISSVEFASAALLGALRKKLLNWAGGGGARQFLFLSRRDQTRRRLLNEAEIEDIAREEGFHIVQPETMNFEDQIRMFASAGGVAAPEGAALANTMFSEAGMRVLSILSENDLFPTYNDLAVVHRQHHRKLTGLAERDDYGMNYIWAPYCIDPVLARQHLRWILGNGA